MSPLILDEKCAFAAYSMPGDTDHYLVRQMNDSKERPGLDAPYFVIAPFDPSDGVRAYHIQAHKVWKNRTFSFRANRNVKRESINKNDYFNLVNKFINETNQSLEKVVLSRIKSVRLNDVDLFKLFLELKEAYPSAFVYLFNLPGEGSWIGATPELLLEWNKGSARTMALAGTRVVNELSHQIWSEKNKEEQNKVALFIESVFDQSQISYTKSDVENHQAGNIEHLCTRYNLARLEDPWSLLHNLHPTPAVCGMPVSESKNYLLDNEPHDRRFYAGYLGPMNIHPKNACFVNLRCMELSENMGYIYVGSGIMPDSEAEEEWIETEEKAQTLLSIIDTCVF